MGHDPTKKDRYLCNLSATYYIGTILVSQFVVNNTYISQSVALSWLQRSVSQVYIRIEMLV